MTEKNKKGIKNFAAGRDDEFRNTFTFVGSNEYVLDASKGNKFKVDEEVAKRFGLLDETEPDLIIEAPDNKVRADRKTGKVERILDGKPALIAEKNSTVVIVDQEALDRMYRAAELTQENTVKKTRGRKPKQDKEQEDR